MWSLHLGANVVILMNDADPEPHGSALNLPPESGFAQGEIAGGGSA